MPKTLLLVLFALGRRDDALIAKAAYDRGVADERRRMGLPALVPAARRPDREAAPA